jgi:hypothetical protein
VSDWIFSGLFFFLYSLFDYKFSSSFIKNYKHPHRKIHRQNKLMNHHSTHELLLLLLYFVITLMEQTFLSLFFILKKKLFFCCNKKNLVANVFLMNFVKSAFHSLTMFEWQFQFEYDDVITCWNEIETFCVWKWMENQSFETKFNGIHAFSFNNEKYE